MIEYLIKSGLILIILLAVYHLWLEKEKMHKFNRFYLLSSLVFSLTVPLLNLEFQAQPFKAIEVQEWDSLIAQPIASMMNPVKTSPVNQPFTYTIFLIVYSTVAFTLLIRFSLSLIRILSTAAHSTRKKTQMGTLVLLKEKIVPHSFMQFTFLSEEEYLQNKVESEVLAHEFAHIKQKHSIDVLLIEILRIIFWFNPVLVFYKKAIQLNHEFLADEAVINAAYDISAYQYLLLRKARLQTVVLASNLNYSITKQRIQMMKKQTSKTRKMIKGFSLIPVAALLVIAFCNQLSAQGQSVVAAININPVIAEQISKDAYYNGALMRFKDASGKDVGKKYEELSEKEKSMFPAPALPTEALMKTWADSKKFIVLFNFDRPTVSVADHKASDFVSYYLSSSNRDDREVVFLITKSWLENIKKLGGSFLKGENGVMLTPPPPIMIPAKK